MKAEQQSHLILGTGVIGRAVANELHARSMNYRIASRSKTDLANHIELDALDKASLISATKGVTHLFVAVGIFYKLSDWQEQWPSIVRNIIEAAQINKFKVAFFDNIYMYGPAPLRNPITEEHSQDPPSKKGIVRKQIADELLAAHRQGKIEVVICRSADFYGPQIEKSILYVLTLRNLLKQKKAQFIGNPYTKHAFTYTEDAARGMVALALDPDAYGQAWHLPTNQNALTTAELIAKMAVMLDAPTKISVMPKPVLKILKKFVPILKEIDEMTYQNESDYIFSSDKFMRRYPDFVITGYDDGLKKMVSSFSKNK